MLLDFGYLYKFVVLFLLLKKTENNNFKKVNLPKFCNIIFLLLLKIGSIRPADQNINLPNHGQNL